MKGEWVTSALGWGSVALLGFGLVWSNVVIQNSQRLVPLMSTWGFVGFMSKVALLRSSVSNFCFQVFVLSEFSNPCL